jgi:hypothetical protein
MKSLKEEELKRLEKALAAAHKSRGGPGPGDSWEMEVMNSIRRMPDASEAPAWTDMFGKMFWRICPVACAIIILLAVAVYRYDVTADQYFARIVADDSVELVLMDDNS